MSNNQQSRFSGEINGNTFSPGEDKAGRTSRAFDRRQEKTEKQEKNKKKTAADRKLKIVGGVFAALFAVMLLCSPKAAKVNYSQAAKAASASGISTELPIGTVLHSYDEVLLGEDLTIAHSSQSEETTLHIWDYASEDGDYVQILVDGVAITDPFMIKNKPREFTVPAVGEIQILGIRDGGGGITYAVHYDINGTTYYNGTDVDDGNLYTLTRE